LHTTKSKTLKSIANNQTHCKTALIKQDTTKNHQNNNLHTRTSSRPFT